jgi:GNAT superfamily N-acetyltransferase/SAM-dependent methyltransferase
VTTIREFRPGDAPVLWTLSTLPNVGHTADPAAPLNLPAAPEAPIQFADLADISAHFVRPGGVFLVAEHDGHVVGMGGFRPNARGQAEVLRVRIHPALRRIGIGRTLMAELEARATARGFHEMFLDTATNMPDAMAFYQSLGYHETGRETRPDWSWTLVYYTKQLTPRRVDHGRMRRMSTRALSFGAIAEAYERFRPGYPEALFDVVAEYAGEPIRTALEIGAGTGKATRLFASHGIHITATEPDAAMLAVLQKTARRNVTPVNAAFEDLKPGQTYDLVYVAAALHWTRPEGRWERVAALLEPHGVVASFGGSFQLADPAAEHAVQAARAPFLESDEVLPPDGTSPEAAMKWPGTELQKSDLFHDVQQTVVERRYTTSVQGYIGYLSTVSAYLQLPDSVRQQVFDAIARVLPVTVEINADVIAHLARRVQEPGSQ